MTDSRLGGSGLPGRAHALGLHRQCGLRRCLGQGRGGAPPPAAPIQADRGPLRQRRAGNAVEGG